MYLEIPKIRKETSLKTVPGFGLTVDPGRLVNELAVGCRSTAGRPYRVRELQVLAGRLPVDWSKTICEAGRVSGRLPVDR